MVGEGRSSNIVYKRQRSIACEVRPLRFRMSSKHVQLPALRSIRGELGVEQTHVHVILQSPPFEGGSRGSEARHFPSFMGALPKPVLPGPTTTTTRHDSMRMSRTRTQTVQHVILERILVLR